MPDLTLKGIPASLHQRLKTRAAGSRRSLSQEAIACLESVVMAEQVDPEALVVEARRLRQRISGRLTDRQLRGLKAAGRP